VTDRRDAGEAVVADGDPAEPPTGTMGTPTRALEPPTRAMALLYGLLAAGTALLVLVLGHLSTGQPGFLEAVADGVPRYVPLDVFDAVLSALGPLAKGLLYGGVAMGLLLTGSLLGLVARRPITRGGLLVEGIFIAGAVLLIAEGIVLPLTGLGPFGVSATTQWSALHVPVVGAAVAYALVLVGLRTNWRPGARAPVVDEDRRDFLGRALALVAATSLGLALAAVAGQIAFAARKRGPSSGASLTPFGPTPALTPVDAFYRVDKNLLPTMVDGSTWRLAIDGLVEVQQALSLDDLRAMPAQEGYRTLECISFEISRGDTLISNQMWRGVRVSDLLDRAAPASGAAWVLWEAADGYTESIPLAVARHPDTWVAYAMGGAPLPAEHGFPARVLIAGRFGMKQPKWLRRMTLSDHDESGYWEQRGWDRDAFVKTMSRIDYPAVGEQVPAGQAFTCYGIANSGDRRIARVELSPDGGTSWLNAELEDASQPPLGPLTWVRWRVQVTVANPGPVRLVVRAADGAGQLQDGRDSAPLPSGSTGWHAIRVIAG
jgi:DMSO/TMAO reductase YedYZ molybdopterin-dependent catalytic subunit